ncbi:MAG TPA: DMT family transporter [Vicinamibacterales bacterium]|nr:DMT family transporter [Vicinamibacterales bacterium]
MPLTTLTIVLFAAFIHALWNLVVVQARDRTATTVIVIVFGAAVAVPFAIARWHVEAEAWPYIVLSSALELVYFALLVAAYERADMSLVYPIARGSAPVIVLALSVGLVGAPTSVAQVCGVALVAIGVFVVRGIRGGASWRHVGLALAVGLSIAAYVVVDKEGVRYADPITYGTLILGIPGIAAVAYVVARGGLARLRDSFNARSAIGGVFSMAAYALVLIALTTAPAASVAAVRESSVVIAALLGAVVLKERGGPERVIGSVMVLVGVALVVAG